MALDDAIRQEQERQNLHQTSQIQEAARIRQAARSTLTQPELRTLKQLHDLLAQHGILERSHQVLWLRSTYYGIRVESESYLSPLKEKRFIDYTYDTPTYFLAFCDSYVFASCKYPVTLEGTSRMEVSKLYQVLSYGNYEPFVSLAQLVHNAKNPERVLKGFPNLQILEGATEEEFRRISQPSDSKHGRAYTRRRKLAKFFGVACVVFALISWILNIVGYMTISYNLSYPTVASFVISVVLFLFGINDQRNFATTNIHPSKVYSAAELVAKIKT